MKYNVRVNGDTTITRNYYQDLQIEAETEEEALEEALVEASENGLEWTEDVEGSSWSDSHLEVEVGDAEVQSSEVDEDYEDPEDE